VTAGRRLAAVAVVLAALLPWPAAAADVYFKIPPFVLEMWDANGVFHMVDIELDVAFPGPPKLPKTAGINIQQALQTLPYEELKKPSGVATIKSMAFDIIRGLPGGNEAEDVLVQKLMFR
jgi:hypothetical protein